MPNLDLNELKSHPAVFRLYSSRVPGLQKNGREWKAKCPIHGEQNGQAFTIKEDHGALIWYCFGACQTGGSIIDLVQKQDHCTTKRAIEVVNEYCGASYEHLREKVDKTFRPAVEPEKRAYVTYTLEQWSKYVKELAGNASGLAWLSSRGITPETAMKMKLGYRQDISKFCHDKDIADQGWIAFPCVDGDKVTCIKYRSVVRKAFARQPNMETSLFNLNDIDMLEPVLLVEGEPDAAILKQAGFSAVSLASASSYPTPEQKDRIMQAEFVVLAGDMDSAGSGVMDKLWRELQGRCYRLKWPPGMKDANQTFLDYAARDGAVFRALVESLIQQAKASPLPNVYGLQEILLQSDRVNLADDPRRFRWPWPSVDRMAILLPGSVATVFSTNTKMAKTTWVMNGTLYAAKRHGETVLNYSAELQPEEFAAMVAAHVLRKDRNHLDKEDNADAARRLRGVKYYIGNDPTLTTVDAVLDLIEAAIRRLGATVVVLDTLHFYTTGDNAIQEQAAAMQRMKLMAGKYGVKFIVVGQPRKAKSDAKGKVVHVTDMKGSEAIMSTADANYVIHREYHKERTVELTDDYDPRAEIHLLFARSRGDGGVMSELYFFGKLASFNELVKEEPPAGIL